MCVYRARAVVSFLIYCLMKNIHIFGHVFTNISPINLTSDVDTCGW